MTHFLIYEMKMKLEEVAMSLIPLESYLYAQVKN
jgi:hypothetical protein